MLRTWPFVLLLVQICSASRKSTAAQQRFRSLLSSSSLPAVAATKAAWVVKGHEEPVTYNPLVPDGPTAWAAWGEEITTATAAKFAQLTSASKKLFIIGCGAKFNKDIEKGITDAEDPKAKKKYFETSFEQLVAELSSVCMEAVTKQYKQCTDDCGDWQNEMRSKCSMAATKLDLKFQQDMSRFADVAGCRTTYCAEFPSLYAALYGWQNAVAGGYTIGTTVASAKAKKDELRNQTFANLGIPGDKQVYEDYASVNGGQGIIPEEKHQGHVLDADNFPVPSGLESALTEHLKALASLRCNAKKESMCTAQSTVRSIAIKKEYVQKCYEEWYTAFENELKGATVDGGIGASCSSQASPYSESTTALGYLTAVENQIKECEAKTAPTEGDVKFYACISSKQTGKKNDLLEDCQGTEAIVDSCKAAMEAKCDVAKLYSCVRNVDYTLGGTANYKTNEWCEEFWDEVIVKASTRPALYEETPVDAAIPVGEEESNPIQELKDANEYGVL